MNYADEKVPPHQVLLFPLRLLSYLFWFVRIDSWTWWWISLLHGPRFTLLRNRRDLRTGHRLYIQRRWGFILLGLTIGDRGGSREWVRRELFGPRKEVLFRELSRLREVIGEQSRDNEQLAGRVQQVVDAHTGMRGYRFTDGVQWDSTAAQQAAEADT